MARTFRRKNFEATRNSSWDTKGFKTAGHYTTYEGNWFRWSGREPVVFRPMTPREAYKTRQWFHGESRHKNDRSPGRYYREYRCNQNRMINKKEYAKWLRANGEYEPFFEANPRDCKWDWR